MAIAVFTRRTNNDFYLLFKLLIIHQILTFGSEAAGSTVSLTVEGGVSLVGPHCPGTVRLFCEGVELTTLRWSYNGIDEVIGSFDPRSNSPSSKTPSNVAFVDLQLTKVINTTISQDLANFSSVLTADLVQLQQQNITSIVCGDPGAMAVTPVGVQVLQPSIPRTPNITTVTATYQSGILNRIKVTWGKLKVDCPEFEEAVVYELALAGVQINQTTCGEMLCEATVSVTEQRDEYVLSLTAINSEGRSERHVHPNTIERQSDRYFSPELAWNNCQAEAQCALADLSSSSNSICTVQYATDPEQFDASTRDNQLSIPFSTQFALRGLSTDTIYYFQFAVVVNNTLSIVETIKITTDNSLCNLQQQMGPDTVTSVLAAVIAFLVLVVIVLIVLLVVFSVVAVCKCNKPKNRTTPGSGEKSPDDKKDENKTKETETPGSGEESPKSPNDKDENKT